jgi:hypothetical protein
MTAKKNGLRVVPKLIGKTGFQYRFDVAAQVMAAGAQDIHVQVIVPLPGPGQARSGSGSDGSLCTWPSGKPWARSWRLGQGRSVS